MWISVMKEDRVTLKKETEDKCLRYIAMFIFRCRQTFPFFKTNVWVPLFCSHVSMVTEFPTSQPKIIVSWCLEVQAYVDLIVDLHTTLRIVRFPGGANTFLLSTAFRWALGPIQPSIQYEPEDLSTGIKPLDVKLTTELHLVQTLRMRGDKPPLHHTSSWRDA